MSVSLTTVTTTSFDTSGEITTTTESTTSPPINAIFTLDSQSILTNPIDILSYVLRYYCTAAKSVSNTTFNQMISIMNTISKYQNNSNTLVQQVTNDLMSVFSRFFPSNSTIVNVTSSDNGDGSYNITIKLAVILNNTSYTLGSDVTVNSNGVLQLKWHPQLT